MFAVLTIRVWKRGIPVAEQGMGHLDAGPAAGFAQPFEVPSHWTPSPHQEHPELRASAEIMLPLTSENNNKHTMVMWHKMAFILIINSCFSRNTILFLFHVEWQEESFHKTRQALRRETMWQKGNKHVWTSAFYFYGSGWSCRIFLIFSNLKWTSL